MLTCLLLALSWGAFCILPFPFNILGMLFFALMALVCFATWLDEPPVEPQVENNDMAKEQAWKDIRAIVNKMKEVPEVEYVIDPFFFKGETYVSTQL